jgi:carboxylesterase
VNPYPFDARLLILPVARRVKRTAKAVGDDIALRGVTEIAYSELPVPAVAQMARAQRLARRDLSNVTAPVLVFRSTRDHVIPRSNARRVFDALGSTRKELIDCPSSFHVVSLDHDASMVRARALDLLRSV